MRNLTVLAAFLLLVVGAFSAGTTCSNSHCTASSPCASVEPYSIANVSCHHIDRVFQIYTKLPGYRVDGTAQLKDVNMLLGSGFEAWPRTIKNVICSAVESYPTPFSSNKTNCQAYSMGTETYLGIKTRDITIHDMYEVVAFAMILGELIRDYNTGNGNTALGPLQALCGEDGLGDTFGSLSPKWRTQNFTNPNSQSSTVSGSYNPFPYHPGYTLYDDQAKLSNFFVRLEEALTDNNAYLIMTYMAPEDLSECLPINTTRYDLDN